MLAHNDNWLALHRERAIDPSLPILDPHHHSWDHGSRYLPPELTRDIEGSGHNVRATVYLQCFAMYRADGDLRLPGYGRHEGHVRRAARFRCEALYVQAIVHGS
jgi:L-fuconolactonase